MRRCLKRAAARRPALLSTTSLVATFAIGACGGVVSFSDTTPLVISGPAPEAPPPPPAPPKRVEIKNDHIEISEKIQFELAKATILPESSGLLDEIVSVLKDNPNITKVDIVGHTSNEGNDIYNQRLSEERAKAVRDYLTKHGIDSGRLASKGLGKKQPIADNATATGREKNRRVEFIIVEQAGGTP